MSSQTRLKIHAAPQPLPARDADLAPLLDEPFARLWDAPPASGVPSVASTAAAALRARVQARAQATHAAEASMVTVRRRRSLAQALAPGVQLRWLYRAAEPASLRPGEPLRVRLIELEAGAVLPMGLLGLADGMSQHHREWLVLSGQVQLGDDHPQTLAERDYHVQPAGTPGADWVALEASSLFLRESVTPALPDDKATTVRDVEAGWPAFAPGIQRRVLWQRDGQAALLYWAEPGAQVPQHSHGHDEECLMVQGELFLDDLLLQAGDYQLAPAGTGHRITQTDTGVVIYAHGDLDLRFTAAA